MRWIPAYVLGGGGHDRMNGAGGDDRLSGLGGNDYFEGCSGHDHLTGGEGDDAGTYDLNDLLHEALATPA